MSTNTIYAKSLLLVRFRNRYWGTIYMNNVIGLFMHYKILNRKYTKNNVSLVL